MKYPAIPDFHKVIQEIIYTAKQKSEYQNKDIDEKVNTIYTLLQQQLEDIKTLPETNDDSRQPSTLSEIKKLRPEGPRRFWDTLSDSYKEKLKGAFYSRIAGCILGSPVEFFAVSEMEQWAKYTNQEFPPKDYWKQVKSPGELRYEKSDFVEYTKDGMKGVPVDDDLVYTILNLLLIEQHGTTFTTENVADIWKKYLPYACTAEEVTLHNLKNGINPYKAAEFNNPYKEWIGADIRSDAFGYIVPGYPEKAAELAYKDAFLSHRRNGIYGAMFFAAAISAAFVVSDSIQAIEVGLTEIPKDCDLARDIKWALDIREQVHSYKDARRLVDDRFAGMEHAHTNNNACLVVFGLHIGGNDITKVIGEIVAMGMDNDCNAATAGSIIGAIQSFENLTNHWYNNFDDTIDTYLLGIGALKISDVLERFYKQAIHFYSR